jgi:hypothetical protein
MLFAIRIHQPQGTYTNNPHTLVRFELPEPPPAPLGGAAAAAPSSPPPPRSYTLVLSQYRKTRDVRYTLNVYCSSLFELQPTPEPPQHRYRVQVSGGAQGAKDAVMQYGCESVCAVHE